MDLSTPILKAFLSGHGIPLSGVGDLREIEAPFRNGFPLAIVLAVPLDRGILNRVFESPAPLDELASEYQRVNDRLRAGFEAGAAFIRQAGFRAIRMDDPFVAYDRATLTARLTHKMCATRAGLGWIGKSGLLVTKAFGSAVRLTTLLTDAPLEAGRPVNVSACGACTACAVACPANAIRGGLWRLDVPRAELLDPAACQAYKHKVAAETGWTNPRCGKCIAACRWTRRYAGGLAPAP